MSNNTFNIDKILEQVINTYDVIDLNLLFEEKLKEYGISKRKASGLLNIDLRTLDDTLNGSAKQPNIINIFKILHFLEIDDLYKALPAILRNQGKENIGAIEKAKNATFIAKNFDIKKLIQVGFFKQSDQADYYINRVLQFFGYDSIFDFNTKLVAPLYSKSKRKFSDKMKNFWIKSAYKCFLEINNPNVYDREGLKDLIIKIKPYSQDVENGLLTVCKALYNVGVTVIVQNQLLTTQVRGGTFIINGKPCIVLTDLFKKYPTIWYTLIHELHHVLYDLETIALTNFHITGDPDLFLIEEKADEFAREYFFGVEKYKFIRPHINMPFLVEKFAKELEIHSSIIYSAFQYFEDTLNGRKFYAAFKEYFPDYFLAVKKLNPITWNEDSLPQVAKKLKSIFELNHKM